MNPAESPPPPQPRDSAAPRNHAFPVILALLVATAAKLYCAATTMGTDDTLQFRTFGRIIAQKGLAYLYNLSPAFNHTPLVGLWSAFAWLAGGNTFFGQPFLLRLPSILADVVTVGALLRLQKERGSPSNLYLILLALCPMFFMVSGFHGNVDSVMVMFLTLAAIAGWRGDALWCGIWLGLSANIKVVGLLLAPVFFFHLLERRTWRPFLAGAAVTVLGGWAFPLIVCPAKFLSNVIGYNSYWGLWGITYWLRQTGAPEFQTIDHVGLPAAEQHIMTGLKLLVIGAVLWMAWRRRRERDLFQPLAFAWVLFFAFSPGGSPQYLIWPIPILVAAAPKRSLYFLATLSIYQFTCYNTASHGLPWFRASEPGFNWMFVGHLWADLGWAGFLVWALLELVITARLGRPEPAAIAAYAGAESERM